MQDFLYALQFLTRLPVPLSSTLPDDPSQGRMALYYPLVGLVIGVLLCLVLLLIGGGSSGMQAALLLATWVGISGALHLDGLADLADAWVGGQGDRQRTLEIMKDPASGPAGVTALVVLLLLKFTALEQLLAGGEWTALLLVPLIGRAGILAAMCFLPYVRADGLGAVQSRQLPRPLALRLLLVSALTPILVWGGVALLPLTLVAGCFLLLRQALMSRLGGITGDGIGAICEILEAAALVGLALAIGS